MISFSDHGRAEPLNSSKSGTFLERVAAHLRVLPGSAAAINAEVNDSRMSGTVSAITARAFSDCLARAPRTGRAPNFLDVPWPSVRAPFPLLKVSRLFGTLVSGYDPRWSVLILFFYYIDSRCSSTAITIYRDASL
jgi:hypothetical protein